MNIKTVTSILFFLVMTTFTQVLWGQNGTNENDSFLSHYPEIDAPDHLHVIDRGDMSGDEFIMIITLQGNLAQDKPRIFITDRESDMFWLETLKEKYGVTTEVHSNAMGLLEKFKDEVDGYIIGEWHEPSLNTATSLAAIKNGFVIPPALEDEVQSLGLILIDDARNIEPGSVFDNYKDEFNNSILFTSENHIVQLRDYMIAAKGMVYHEDADVDGIFFDANAVYDWIENDSPQIGWGGLGEHDEFEFVNNATEGGLFTNPANYNLNISVLAGIQQDSLEQNGTKATVDNIETPEEAHYLAINMSDGDNYAFSITGLADESKYFGSSVRGEFAMNWTIPGSMIELAPVAMNWYYEQASDNDYFVIGGTGAGYMFPSRYPHLEQHLEVVDEYMGRSDLSYVGMLDPVDFGTSSFYETASKYTAQPNIEGVYYLNYWQYENGDGQITFIDGKPVIAMRENMWGLNDNQIISLAEKINNHSRNLKSPKAYSIMNLHAWTHKMADVELLVEHLDDHVKVVTIDELFQQVVKNVDPDYDPADDLTFGDNILPNHDFSDGFNNWRLVKDHSDANIQDVEQVYLGGAEGQTLTYTGYNLLQIFSDQLVAEPSKYYKIRVKAQVFGEHDNQANYKIRFYDQAGDFIDEVNKYMPVNTDGFVYLEAAMQAPGNAAYMDVELAVWKDDTQLEIEVDEVLLMREVDMATSSSEQLIEHADRFQLKQNYPNPFNPTTQIEFSIVEPSNVTLEVFNIQGQRVATLMNETKSAGVHTVNFNAASLSSGLYIYRLQAGSYTETKRMTLIK